MSYVLAFLGFVALIILHEAGHFTAAKAVGMRVERFSLFMGPLLVKFRRGETEYGIGPFPLGGYVRITGMNPREELSEDREIRELNKQLDQLRNDPGAAWIDGPVRVRDVPVQERAITDRVAVLQAQADAIRGRAYYNQKVWKRIVVILAGPAVNLVIAFVIFWAIALSNGQQVANTTVQTVTVNGPSAAYIRPGDKVVSVDGVSGSEDAIRNQIGTHRCAGAQVNNCVATTPARVVVNRDGKLITLAIRPRYSTESGENRPLLGISFGSTQEPVGVVKAASLSGSNMWYVTTRTVSVVARLFEPQERKQLHSIVYGYTATQESFATSTTQAFYVLGLISLSLAIINLFPFLPLDGGHVFWAVAEKVRGKRIPFEVMERAGVVGFVLILLVFVIGLSNDITTLSGPGGLGLH
ncbi:MAG TPA: RIP metalloprotease [Solirubrobacteraceae bacterium]|nr:RIP metalloprotease [Solirubrobacteraceae bacterium]